jgi:hypothetical protein
MRDADLGPLIGIVDPARQHHVGHARGADQARQAGRAAAADEQAAWPFRQGIEGAALRHPDVRRTRQLQPAADHRACSTAITGTRPNWTWSNAACQARECSMPSATLRSLSSGQVEPGAEVLALAAQHDDPHRLGQADQAACSSAISASLNRIALGRPVQTQLGDGALHHDAEDGGGRAACRFRRR